MSQGEVWVRNGLRVLATFVILTGILLLVAATSGAGGESIAILLFLIFAPIPAAITIGAVALVGLPLRVGPRLRPWWERSGPTFLIVAAVGILSIVLGFVLWVPDQYLDELGQTVLTRHPNSILLWGGWFAVAFGVMHIRSPFRVASRWEGTPGGRGFGDSDER